MKRNLFYQTAYQILIIVLPLITAPYVSRILEPEGIGVYSYSYSIVSIFVVIAKMGIDNYGNRTIASVRDNREQLRQNFSNIYYLHIILTSFVLIAYLVYCFFSGSSNRIAAWIQSIYLIAQFFDVNWLFFGLEEFKLSVIRNAIIRILCTVLIFVLIKSKGDVLVYLFLLGIASLLSELTLFIAAFKKVSFTKPNYSEMKKHLGGMWIFFIPAIAVTIYKIMDKAMLGAMSSTQHVGYYENTEKIINICLALITALGTVMMPRITNMVSNGATEQPKILFRKSTYFTFIAILAMVSGIIGISNTFPSVFWGKSFKYCEYLMIGLALSLPFTALANVLRTQYLIPYKKEKIYVSSVIIGAIVNAVGNMILISRLASIGAVISTVLAESVVFFYQTYKCRHVIKLSAILKPALSYLLMAIIMGISVWNVGYYMGANIATLIIQIIVGIIVYFLGIFVIAKVKKDKVVLGMVDDMRMRANLKWRKY